MLSACCSNGSPRKATSSSRPMESFQPDLPSRGAAESVGVIRRLVLPVTQNTWFSLTGHASQRDPLATPLFPCSAPSLPFLPTPILQAHRHPGDRVLTRSTTLRSATRTAFGPLPPPCAGRGLAAVTPGVRKTSRRSCRPRIDPLSVGRCAPPSEGFCSSRSP